jgi:hypothetical protein
MRFSQLYPVLKIKNRFRPRFPNVHMNWSVIVAVKTEFETIFFKNNRHGRNILYAPSESDIFLRTSPHQPRAAARWLDALIELSRCAALESGGF